MNYIEMLEKEVAVCRQEADRLKVGLRSLIDYAGSLKYAQDPYVHKNDIMLRAREALSDAIEISDSGCMNRQQMKDNAWLHAQALEQNAAMDRRDVKRALRRFEAGESAPYELVNDVEAICRNLLAIDWVTYGDYHKVVEGITVRPRGCVAVAAVTFRGSDAPIDAVNHILSCYMGGAK
jgi:hypothetical protein